MFHLATNTGELPNGARPQGALDSKRAHIYCGGVAISHNIQLNLRYKICGPGPKTPRFPNIPQSGDDKENTLFRYLRLNNG
jgi:hypothetical protein